MEYRKLGQTGIDVSVIALGCWPFAGGAVWGEQNDDDSIAAVHAALDVGINFFDTAEGYGPGRSEEVLGRGLKGRRDQAVIATKVSGANLAADDVIRACEQSLIRLETDYIDLYQIHWPNWNIPLAETVGALETLKQQGKVRAIGVSNFAVRDLSEITDLTTIETDQLPFSLLWRVLECEIQPRCIEKGTGIICYSPLSQGLLTGRYAAADEVPAGLARTRLYANSRPQAQHSEPGCESEIFTALSKIRRIADELGRPMATMSLAWVKQQPGVTSLLVGARKPEEVHWNLPAVELTLSDEVMAALATAAEPIKEKLGNNPDMWMSKSRMR